MVTHASYRSLSNTLSRMQQQLMLTILQHKGI